MVALGKENPKRPATSAQLRRDISSGRARSKVSRDPAAAPLGTDDEAAGMPPSAAEIHMARQFETDQPPVTMQPDGRRFSRAWVFAGIGAGAILVVIWLAVL
jgi:hypothetical protein